MTNNNFHISIPVSGLIKREDYTYEILGVGGNWPAIANPASGEFVASSKSKKIDTTITFLPTTGNIHNSLDYELSSCGYANTELFTNVVAKVTSLSDNTIVFSNPSLIKCSGCLPKITVNIVGCSAPDSCKQYNLTSTNIFDFQSSISGIEPNTKYHFIIESFGSNWPSILMSPLSGSFVASSNTYDMKHKMVFCPYSGLECGQNNLLDYDLARCFNKNNIYTNLQLSIFPDYCQNEKVFSNNILVNCENCLPKINASIPSNINLTLSNIVDITGNISGLIPNTRYYYQFNSPNSNWPTIISPLSGSFLALSNSEQIVSSLMFCSPSGNCPSGTENLLPYELDSMAETDLNQDKLRTEIILNVTSECGDDIDSKKSIISCDNCLPCLSYANAIFEDAPVIGLDDDCCVGQKLIKVNVTNAIVGDKYLYEFSTSSGVGVNNIEFNPTTGEMYFGGSGLGSIMTICSIDLIDYTQTLINFQLTHVSSNTQIFDTIGLVCNTGSCY
jgi:hypothetical protein